jgi:hypothetical protein
MAKLNPSDTGVEIKMDDGTSSFVQYADKDLGENFAYLQNPNDVADFDTLYVGYKDGGNSNKTTVDKFVGSGIFLAEEEETTAFSKYARVYISGDTYSILGVNHGIDFYVLAQE